jgi:peptidoglycan/xylan/chitin deacetylase (PgdA/CDA1 family)
MMKQIVKKQTKSLIFLISILIIFLTSCATIDSQSKNPAPIRPDYSYLEHSKSENQEAGTIESIIEYGDYSVLGVHYPLFGKDKLDALTKELMGDYIHKFKSQVEDHLAKDKNYKSEMNIDYETWLFKENIVSIKFTILVNMSYYANPDIQIATLVYDLEKQQELTLDDILANDYLEKISHLTMEKFKADQNYRDYLDDELFRSGTAPHLKNYTNFILQKDSIVFLFQKYQLFPGVAGQPFIEIAYTDLEGYLQPLGSLRPPPDSSPAMPTEIVKPLRKIDPAKPMVALTFDDGPYAKTTISILDTLKANDAVATFFILGNRVANNKSILTRMLDEGNEVGNHSYNHKQLTTLTPEELSEQIGKTQNALLKNVGYIPKLIRPTYGSVNDEITQTINMPIILWSIDTVDWKNQDASQISRKVLENVRDGDIILMHDIYADTAKAVKKIVPALKKQGYQLVTVSELYELRGETLKAGQVYHSGYKI